MTEDLLDHWLRIIKPLFPANAWFVGRLSKGDHVIEIDWRLGDDPHQPSKRSRKIEIIIREETVDGYLDLKKTDRELSDLKMKEWISEQYKNFDPDHEAQSSRSISTEKWRISKDILSP
jgi:hypothetical protein